MSRREKEKAKSLDALARFAYGSPGAPPPPVAKPAAAPKPRAPPARPARASPPPGVAFGETEAERSRRAQLAQRREKLEEERRLRQRRANELARSGDLSWRGMDTMGVPASIRRTGFDREEPNVSQKLHDVLGDPAVKEGRARNRAKGRRQGGR